MKGDVPVIIISSLIQLPTLTPAPQLRPPLFIKLRASSPFTILSLRSRELDIGIPPAYCEMLPLRAPYDSVIIIGISLAAWSWLVRLDFGCPDWRDAMSIGAGILRAQGLLFPCDWSCKDGGGV